jgi:hypothetical protein
MDLARAGVVERTTHDGFVNIYVAIPDFQVKATIRVSTDPGFVMDIGPLTTEIGKGYQISAVTLLTFRKTGFVH